MSDEGLRAQARADDPEEWASHLRARERAGTLSSRDLAMAARLDPAAALALEGRSPLELSEWPDEARLRFEVAACWTAFPVYQEENRTFTGNNSPLLIGLLRTLDRFVLGSASPEELLSALEGAQKDWAAGSAETAHHPEDFAWLLAARCAAWAIRESAAFQGSDCAWRSQEEWGLGMDWCLDPSTTLVYLTRVLGEPDPIQRVRAELVPWLTAGGDPVQERVAASSAEG